MSLKVILSTDQFTNTTVYIPQFIFLSDSDIPHSANAASLLRFFSSLREPN